MEVLSGWKEIAEHLHTGVRTAQRWEQLGLPVRRVSPSSCSPVVAICDELELWTRQRKMKAKDHAVVSSSLLASKLAELRSMQYHARRRTRRLLEQIDSLTREQRRLVGLVRANLSGGN